MDDSVVHSRYQYFGDDLSSQYAELVAFLMNDDFESIDTAKEAHMTAKHFQLKYNDRNLSWSLLLLSVFWGRMSMHIWRLMPNSDLFVTCMRK